MSFKTAGLIAIPLAALVVGGGAGVAAAFDPPHPASGQVTVTTGTPSGQVNTARLTLSARQQATTSARPVAVSHAVTQESHQAAARTIQQTAATRYPHIVQHVGEHGVSGPMGRAGGYGEGGCRLR